MGRPSKLTDAQWETIGKRLLANESAASLAREYGVSKAVISARFSKRTETIKTVAKQIVDVERSLSFLNVSEQLAARSLADDLKAISNHLTGAARFGAATAHRLSGIAHAKVEEIDDAAPLDTQSIETLKGVAVLTRMANSSSEIAINLLRANKETVDDLNRQDLHPEAAKRIREVRSGMTWVYGALESDEEES
ncbi:helix-turn-helix domain-containing protein [Paraburkholderia sediminicola]|uniref:helix-turn-helix domain-containing protein n=1 Tax=Paraburkholderia sediminicola TaxID=458836 RepID=UPI0038BA347E